MINKQLSNRNCLTNRILFGSFFVFMRRLVGTCAHKLEYVSKLCAYAYKSEHVSKMDAAYADKANYV